MEREEHRYQEHQQDVEHEGQECPAGVAPGCGSVSVGYNLRMRTLMTTVYRDWINALRVRAGRARIALAKNL